MVYYYTVNGTNITYPLRTWIISSSYGRGFSIFRFFEDLNTYISAGLFGFDNFGKYFIAVIILILVVGGLSMRYGVVSEPALMGIVFGVVLFLDQVGFIPSRITVGDITSIPHFITFITAFILFIMIIREEMR
jgi:hypothetical protein